MPQIENRPVFFKSLSFWKVPLTSLQQHNYHQVQRRKAKKFMFRLMQTLDQLTTAGKWGEWWCLQTNDQINWKRQNSNWIWWCYLKGFITLSAWQLSHCIASSGQQTGSSQSTILFLLVYLVYPVWVTHHQYTGKTQQPPWSKHYIHIAVHNSIQKLFPGKVNMS